jgi:CubicO group peptidase (beta-lactamase class C family)
VSRSSANLVRWLVVTAGCASPAATTTTSRGGGDAMAAIAADIRGEIATGRLTGVSVALVQHGQILWEDGFGFADRAAGRKATSRTPFSIASTTKPFTTTAAMTLVAAGKLAWDRPANDYLGADRIVDDRGPAQAVTVRRLASHSSGLPTFFAMYPDGRDQPSVSDLLRDYGHVVAPPGERYEYSNLALAVLAEIVERQSGEPFGKYLQSHVLGPLGMADSFFDTDVARRGEIAVRYDDAGEALPFYLTATPGSGEMYASAHDLARFAMLHLEDHRERPPLLSEAALDELHHPATAVAGPAFSYGLGWQVLRRPGEPEVLYHGGGQSGVDAEFVLVPAHDAACIVLSNRRGDRPFIAAVRDRLLASVVPGWHGIPDPPQPRRVPLAPAADYVGDWHGDLLGQGRRARVRLTIETASQGSLTIGDAPAAPIADLGLVDGLISGGSKGDLDTPDTRRYHLEQLDLTLKLRGATIDGEITAYELTSRNMAIFPYWVELHRAAR